MEKENINGLKGLEGLKSFKPVQENIVIPRLSKEQLAGVNTQGLMNTPLKEYVGTSEIGQSMYDADITRGSQLDDLANTRGELQPWYAQLSAGVGKMGVLAGTTFLNSTLGLVAGVGTAVTEGRWSGLWDNDVNKFLDNVNKKSEEIMPNYYTNAERDEPWYNNIFTANFLGDKVLKNMGFTMGAIAAGALTGGFGSGLLSGAGKIGSIASKVMATTVSAAGEASIEALNASNDFMAMNSQNIDRSIGEEKSALDSKYASYIAQGVDPNILHSKYKDELKGLEDKREMLLAEANEEKLKVGNTTFALNQALLSLTNSVQFGRELAGGFKNAQRAKSLITKSASTGEAISGAKAVGKALLEKDLVFEANKGYGRALAGNIAKNVASEGFEEGAQNVASNASQMQQSAALNTFAGAKINPQVQDNVNDLLSATGQAISEQFGSVDSPGWEEVFLGGLSGAIGVPFLKRGKGGLRATWAGGVQEAVKETKEDFKANDVVEKINANIQKPEFVNKYQGLIRHQAYQQKMDEALDNGSEFEYENNETSQLISDVLMFNEAGALDGFKAFTKSFKQNTELTDEQVADLKQNTLGENGKSIYDGLNKEQIKENINKNSEKTDKMIDTVMDVHNEHLVKYGDTFNKEELEELTWLKTKAIDWQETAKTKYAELQNTLRPVLEQLDREEVKDAEGNVVRVSDLLNRTPAQFVAEMTMPDATLRTALFKVLDAKRGEFASLTKEARELEDKLKTAPKKGKGSRTNAKMIASQLESVVAKLEEVANSNTLLEVNTLKAQLNNVIAPIVASTNFAMKYREAVNNPSTLKESIIKEKDTAATEQVKIQTEKNVAKLKVATNLAQLKKNSAGMSVQERSQALSELAKEKSFVGGLAQELSNMDRMHRSLGNLLESSEFTDTIEEDKMAAREAIDTAFKSSEKIVDMISSLEAQATENPVLANLLQIKKETDDEIKTYKDEKPTATPTPTKPKVVKEEIDLDEAPEEAPEVTTEEEVNPELNTGIDATFLTEEDYIKINTGLTEFGIQDTLDNPEQPTEEIRNLYKALYSKLLTDKEVLIKYSRYSEGLDESTYKNEAVRLRAYFDAAKERSEILKENKSSKDNPESFEELGKALEEVAVVIDNSNVNKSGEIRSDAITEAAIELLMPKGQGTSGKGNRQFTNTKQFDKRYEHIWDYLQTSGAFDFVNSGKLADLRDKDEHTKVHFIVDKTLNSYTREGGTPLANVVLMAVEANTPTSVDINGTKYQIVGALKANTEYITGLQSKILTQSKASTEDKFVSPDYSEIDFIYPGRIATSKVGQPETERDIVSNGKPLFFGVFKKERIFSPNVPEGKSIEPTTEDNKEGRVYLMIKAADGKFYPTPVRRKMFTEADYPQETYGNTSVYQAITDALSTLANPNSTDSDRYFARDMFEKFIYFGNKVQSLRAGSGIFRIKWQKDKLTGRQWIQISRETGEEDADGKKIYQTVKKDGKNYVVPLTSDFEANKAALLELVQFMEPMFQINSKLLENEQYVDMLVESGVFTSNLADYTLHNAMFTIKPMDKNGVPIQSEAVTEKPVATEKNPVGSADTYTIITDKKGTEYKLYPNGDIYNAQDERVTRQILRAYIYAKDALAKGTALNKKQYGDDTLYTLSMDNGEYAVLVSKEGIITDIYSGDKFIQVMKDQAKYVADEAQAKAVAEALATSDTSIDDLANNGYDPTRYIVDIQGAEEGYRGFIYSKATGEKIMTTILSVDRMKEMGKLTSSYTEEEQDNMELMNPIIAPILSEVLKSHFGDSRKETTKAEEQNVLNSVSANGNPLGDNQGWVTATDMPTIAWGKGITQQQAMEDMKKAIKAKFSKAPETETVAPKPKETKEKGTVSTSNPLVAALGNNLQTEKNIPKDLHMSEEIHIFANLSVEELSKLRAALKGKGISVRNANQIAQATMTLLEMNEAELLALDTDAIIGKINCK